jgi:hypothetical protein
LQKSSSSPVTAPENLFDGAKLTWECVVDVGASSSSIPDNDARKPVDGTVMMVPKNLLAFVDEVKMTGQLENPKRRF